VQDKIIKCRDCGQEFVFTTGEQDFYAQKGFSEPVRCFSCRAARKASRGEGGLTAFVPRSREMHSAVCGQCGKHTQVPFEPRGSRPIYCSDCFSRQRSAAGDYDRPFGDERSSRGRSERRSSRERSGVLGDRDRRHDNDRW
jgi:CxxC-x17-CxxC domain-containing protein